MSPASRPFDLDKAISSWKWRLRLRRFFIAEDLDELEAHLRDHVEVLEHQGLLPREAFAAAVERLGAAHELESEYRKVRFARAKQRRSLVRSFIWSITMFRTYLKTAVRNVKRHKGYAGINIGGFAVGLAACLLIGLFVRDEFAFDRFHAKAERIHRLGQSTVGWPYGRILESEYPEVEKVSYVRSYPSRSIKHSGAYYYEPMLHADNAFFDLFSFPMVEGDAASALSLPYSVVLSESFARTLFGTEKALGQTLVLSDSLRFTVSGVAHVPKRSHIQFASLVSFETLRSMNPEWYDQELAGGWLDLNVVNYVLLRDGVDAAAFRDKIRDLPTEKAGDFLANWGSPYRLDLEPMTDIYLRSSYGNQLGPKASIETVWLLAAIGLFLLLIAVVNFVNLTTARSVDRAREVGVRKVSGSSRAALIRQFLGESVLTSLVAVLLAFGLALLALPLFNDLAARSYEARDLVNGSVLLSLAGLTVLVGLLAGMYPAFALSSFRPIQVLTGRFASSRRGRHLRQGLVVFQFVISGVLVIGTLVVLSQLRFMRTQELGFDAAQVVVLDARRAPRSEVAARGETIRQELLSYPEVTEVSQTAYVPGRGGWRGQLSFPEGMPDGQSVALEYVPVDFNYVRSLGLKMIAGRDFDESFATDAADAVIINEAAVRVAGWPTPGEAVGKSFTSPGSRKPNGVVVGVVEDYHHHGLKERIEPMMFGISMGGGMFAMRVRADETAAVLPRLRQTWAQFFEGYPYETFFLDEDFARQYVQEQRLGRLFSTFALLTILIASLGLFGLAAFTATQRTREIGVRKVMGAPTLAIVALLSRGFLRNVVIAFAIAVPVAYYSMSRWLDQFAYRTGIGLEQFVIAGVILLVISLATVSFQAFRAAVSDPVRSLRSQ